MKRNKTIFYDVDTQNDFMNQKGALYVPEAEEIKGALAELTQYACEKGIPIFGSVDRHFGTEEYKEREGELKRNGGPFPDHCFDGTAGQKKIAETEHPLSDLKKGFIKVYGMKASYIPHPLDGKKNIFIDNTQEISVNKEINDKNIKKIINQYFKQNTWQTKNAYFSDPRIDKKIKIRKGNSYITAGIFFEKQHYDVSTNPWFEKVIKAHAPHQAVVYGVATDYCVRAGALALRKAGVPEVYLVTDAIRGIKPEDCKKTLEELASAGVKFATSKEVLEGRL